MLNNFRRFEFKFLLTNDQFNSIKHDLLPYVNHDKHNKNNEPYNVRSIYYDNPQYESANEKIDGLLFRYKYRLRTYASKNDKNALFFFERKGRFNNYVFKERTDIKPNDIKYLNHSFRLKNSDLLDRFYKDLIIKNLKPIIIIDYKRLAFFSKFSDEFRLTFDSDLTALESDEIFPKNFRTVSLFPDKIVMELKFSHKIPIWFHKLIEKNNLTRVSISKVCSGLQRLGYVYDEGQ